MDERRRGKRQRSWFVLRLEDEQKGAYLAMSRNVSLSGALVATSLKLEVGHPITVSFKASPSSPQETTVRGTIVRVEPNAEDPDGLWPHRVAIEFDERLPEVEPEIEQDSGTWDMSYLLDLEKRRS